MINCINRVAVFLAVLSAASIVRAEVVVDDFGAQLAAARARDTSPILLLELDGWFERIRPI